MLDFFQYNFMVRAFLAGGMIAVIAPLIGNFLVIRRYSLIADTLAHISLAGVAIALILNTQPLLTTIITTVLCAIAIEKIKARQNISEEAILAMFLPGGLSLALVLMSLANGFNANLFGYLFGSITTVRDQELWLIFALGILTVITIFLLRKKLLFAAFDEDSARVRGIHVNTVNTILVALTAVIVSLSIRVVGVLLIGALIVIPVITAMQIAKSFSQSILLSVIFAIFSVFMGLTLAYYASIPAGGSIVLLSLLLFSVVSVLRTRK